MATNVPGMMRGPFRGARHLSGLASLGESLERCGAHLSVVPDHN